MNIHYANLQSYQLFSISKRDKTVSAGDVLDDVYIYEISLQKFSNIAAEEAVSFENSEASGAKVVFCDVCKGTIELQRVVVRDEQRKVRLVVEDVAAHLRALGLQDIRRVTDYDIEAAKIPERQSFEDVGPAERDAGVAELPSGYRQSFG